MEQGQGPTKYVVYLIICNFLGTLCIIKIFHLMYIIIVITFCDFDSKFSFDLFPFWMKYLRKYISYFNLSLMVKIKHSVKQRIKHQHYRASVLWFYSFIDSNKHSDVWAITVSINLKKFHPFIGYIVIVYVHLLQWCTNNKKWISTLCHKVVMKLNTKLLFSPLLNILKYQENLTSK